MSLNQYLLTAWLRLSGVIKKRKIVKTLSYNEAIVCNYLLNKEDCSTATEICRVSGIKKSQMNRILNSLEERNIIYRERSSNDKRIMYISLNMENMALYQKEHKGVMEIMDTIIERIGPDKAALAADLVVEISGCVDEIIKERQNEYKNFS